jgi:hypothetical protein
MTEFLPVPASSVSGMWPLVRPHLDPSIAMSRGRYETDDVGILCARGHMQLWVALRDDEVIGGMVTEIAQYPRRRIARVVFAGGKALRSWYRLADEAVEDWGRAWGCTGLEAGGRRGWGRLVKAHEDGVWIYRDIKPMEIH